MKTRSIASRLFLLSAGWAIVALAVTALLLTELYASALERQLNDSLSFNLETLVARTLEVGDLSEQDIEAADPRFERTASGWYWQIVDDQDNLIQNSGSLVGSMMPMIVIPFDMESTRIATATDDFGARIRILERRIGLPQGALVFSVAGNLDENRSSVENFRSQTMLVLGAFGIALAGMSAIVGRVALRPIGKLRAEIEDVRDGTQSEIENAYPSELEPLAREVNTLLHANSQIVERARAQVGNLAHGLKTPLAVLRNEGEGAKSQLAKIVRDQTTQMSKMVTTYLERANLAARTAVVGKRTNATSNLQRLASVMQKLHADTQVENLTQEEVWFRGEEGDFEEIVGNLMDNGCKWSTGALRVALAIQPNNPSFFQITIEDDGPGLTDAQKKAALKRGVRLDEKVQGSGLGLDIVKELIDIYGGKIEFSDSELGGLKAVVELPAAKAPSS